MAAIFFGVIPTYGVLPYAMIMCAVFLGSVKYHNVCSILGSVKYHNVCSILGSVKYHNVCSILHGMSLVITVQYLSMFCAKVIQWSRNGGGGGGG